MGIFDLTIDYDSCTHLPTSFSVYLLTEGVKDNICVPNEEDQHHSHSKWLPLIWPTGSGRLHSNPRGGDNSNQYREGKHIPDKSTHGGQFHHNSREWIGNKLR